MKDLLDFSERIVVVTGGTRGLGFEMALGFAERGASVVVASRREESCRAAAARITAETGQLAVGMACHVGRWSDCDDLVEQVYSRFSRCDVLVNNAGLSPGYASLVDVTEELWDKVVAVNLRGPFRLSVLFGSRMEAAGSGNIINVTSVSAVQPTSKELPYACAKAGLNALTVGAAHSFGPNVRVNAIMAGPFLTDISKSWYTDEWVEQAKTRIPMQRAGDPSEIVGAALYLASDAASYTNGAVIKVDGGTAWSPS